MVMAWRAKMVRQRTTTGLRREDYAKKDLAAWREEARGFSEQVFVYFKHEEAGKGPEFGRLLGQRLGLAGVGQQ
jgi:uncharacterized protein YecE (DUF72 family)